jgi:hypothetical protein
MITSAIQQIVNTDRAELKNFFSEVDKLHKTDEAGFGFRLGFRVGIGFRIGIGIVLVDVGYLDIATARAGLHLYGLGVLDR